MALNTYSGSITLIDVTDIKEIENWYLATSASSGVTRQTQGWTTTIQTMDVNNPYLWNYEVVKGTGNVIINTTEPAIIGRYGADGTSGRGITSITEYYKVSTSNTQAPTTWSDTISTEVLTPTDKYLWNYEVITYTSGSPEETEKRIIGVYGDKPIITANKANGQTIITADGTQIATILDGEDGAAGHSPTITTSRASGATTTKILADGVEIGSIEDGDDGHSPVVTTSKVDGVTHIYVDGTETASINDGSSVRITSATKENGITTIILADGSGSQTLTIVDGEDGEDGQPGTNGINSYIHIAWANDTNGTDFSTSVSTNKLYMGTYSDSNVADSTNYRDYNWSRIKGEQGTSVTRTETEYYRRLEGAAAPTSSSTGSTSIPEYVDGCIYYKRTVTYLSNNTSVNGDWIEDATLTNEIKNAYDAWVAAGNAELKTKKIIEDSSGLTIASGINGGDVTEGTTSTYGYNTIMAPNYLGLRYNAINLSKLTTSGLEFYVPTMNGTTPMQGEKGLEINSNTITFYKPGTTNPSLQLSTSALTFYSPSNNTAQFIIGANGTLQSRNYERGDDSKFALDGTRIDLTDGDIITKYFRVSQGLEPGLNPGAYIYGTIEALSGKIGAGSTNYWDIGQYTDYNLTTNATMVGHGGSFIQLGDSSTWRLATNRIHTGWYTTGSTLLNYPQIDSRYWDFGIHVPTTAIDKFLYIRKAKDNSTLTNLLYDIDDTYTTSQWDYKFYIDGSGNITTTGSIDAHSISIDGVSIAGGNLVAGSLASYGGSSTQPVYFPSTGDNKGKPVAINYTIEKSVPSNAKFTDTVTTVTVTGDGNAITAISASNGAITATKGATYLTSYTETDPTVPSWAKASTKPSYSYNEISGTVPQSALPSYVDDVIEYSAKSSFPATGETGKIYVDTSTNLTWRWSGTTYVEISPSLALGETSSTAYRGDRGKVAYDHATDSSKLTTAQNSGFYKFSVTSEGHIGNVSTVTASDIPTLTKSKISDFPTTWALSNITGANDLKAIEALSDTSGLLRKTAANTWSLDTNTYLTEHQDISGKADKSNTVTNIAYDSTNKKITKTINGNTTDVVTIATLKTALSLSKSDLGLNNVTNDAQIPKSIFDGAYQLLYSTAANTPTKLAPNTTNTKKFLRMTGTGSAGAAPVWDTVSKSDVGLGNVVNYAQVTKIGQGTNGKLRVWTGTNPGSTSASDYTDIEIAITAYEQSTVTAAERATNDADGDDIRTTYGHSISISGHTISLKDKNGNTLGNTVTVPDNNTTYTFTNGTNGFTVTPSGGTAQTVTVTPSITNNITGSGTSGYLAKFNGTNTITNGPQFTSGGTGYLKEDGTWGTPGGTYSLPTATYNILGGIKPWFSTTGTSSGITAATYSNSPSISARTTTAGRYYAIEIDKNGRLFVNVPWTNINSSYLTSITSNDVTTALGYTPYDNSNPNGYTTNTGTVTKVTAGTGLSIGSTAQGNFTTSGTINHTNSVTAQTTQAVYPIKIDAQGHISAYGAAQTILSLGIGSSNAYRGDYGNTAYTHATDANRLTTAQSSAFYKISVTAQGHVGGVTAVSASDITGLLSFGTAYNASTNKIATMSDVSGAVGNFLTYNVNEGVSAKKIFAQGTSYGTVSSKTNFTEKVNINYNSTLDAIVFTFNS